MNDEVLLAYQLLCLMERDVDIDAKLSDGEYKVPNGMLLLVNGTDIVKFAYVPLFTEEPGIAFVTDKTEFYYELYEQVHNIEVYWVELNPLYAKGRFTIIDQDAGFKYLLHQAKYQTCYTMAATDEDEEHLMKTIDEAELIHCLSPELIGFVLGNTPEWCAEHLEQICALMHTHKVINKVCDIYNIIYCKYDKWARLRVYS